MGMEAGFDQTILEAVDSLKDEMINSILELVRIDSVEDKAMEDAPFGMGVKQALFAALNISSRLGFDTVNLDNYIGYAQYGMKQEGYVCAIGHVDVVPAGEGWKHPPFCGYMEDGILYGRGVLDNKGPVLACLYGLAALKKLDIALVHPVRIIFGCDEETGFKDLDYYLAKEGLPLYGFTPDCQYPAVYSERGRAVVRIIGDKAKQKPLLRFVNRYFIGAKNTGDRLGIDFSCEEYGAMEMRGYKLSCLKQSAVAEAAADMAEDSVSDMEEARLAGGGKETFEATLCYPFGFSIKQAMGKIQKKALESGLYAELVMNDNPVMFEKDSPMVAALRESYEIVTGLDGTPISTTGSTYAKRMPKIVPFGPSFPGQDGISHNPNEWMSVDDLVANAKIYALALYRLGRLS